MPKSANYLDGTSLNGYIGTDRICPTKWLTSCVNNFKFAAIFSESGLQSWMDGIIGLWSGNIDDPSYDRTQMFVPEMVTDSTITDKVFSWYMSAEAGRTYIDFGTPNSAIYNAAELIWLPIVSNNYWWTNKITGLRWTKNSNDNVEYRISEANAITDTGSSCIAGPGEEVL